LLLLLCYNVCASTLTPFNLSGASNGYIINGTVCETLFPGTCYDSILVLDTPNNRLLIDLGTLGKYVMFQNSAYIYNLVGLTGLCFQVTNWNYSAQAAGYATALSMPSSLGLFTRYAGLARDIAACEHYISLSIIQLGNIIVELDFSQRVPLSGVCQFSTGYISYNLLSLKTTGNRNSYFTLPPSCGAPIDYCSLVYPPGNDCIVPQ